MHINCLELGQWHCYDRFHFKVSWNILHILLQTTLRYDLSHDIVTMSKCSVYV